MRRLALLSVLILGCTSGTTDHDPIDDLARFGEEDQETHRLLIRIATMELHHAAFADATHIRESSLSRPRACKMTDSVRETHIAGPCTLEFFRIDGDVSLYRRALDSDQTTHLELHNFSVTLDESIRFDGTAEKDLATLGIAAELQVDVPTATMTVSARAECDERQLCTLVDGSHGALSTVGGFSINGTFSPDSGMVTLEGANTISYEVVEGTGCYNALFEGTSTEVCP